MQQNGGTRHRGRRDVFLFDLYTGIPSWIEKSEIIGLKVLGEHMTYITEVDDNLEQCLPWFLCFS